MKSYEMRTLLLELLGVRCVFPSEVFLSESSDARSARCMLEYKTINEKTVNYEDSTEDIIARLKYMSDESHEHTAKQIKYLLSKLYGEVDSAKHDHLNESTNYMSLERKKFSSAVHPGIANIIKFIESKAAVVIVQSFAKHSLLSVSRFHTNTTLSSATLGNIAGLGSKDLRIRFVIYQLLQAVAFMHNQGLCLDLIDPASIMLDDDMWLYLPVGMSQRACAVAAINMGHSECGGESVTKHCGDVAVDTMIAQWSCSVERPIGYYEPLTIQWVSGKLSNFEYLMAINHGAGRTMVDPLYHPIIPWVTDFTSVHPSCETPLSKSPLRDLSMTKFRLSKGDAQLETTYKHSDPPHHVPESLSELTYYIYLARRTPMQVLRRVVRDVFVPEHYPHSIGRIYDWTPDECIPEFYCDPSVFASIHAQWGLQDLELPPFANTPELFIKYHRSVLESDEVSSRLHRWIDLTFGFCLEGSAAIENMNVPLRHTLSSSERTGVDSPNVNKNPGFVVLFNCPHPAKQTLRSIPGMTSSRDVVKNSTSHMFSFNKSKESSASFADLHPLYSLNNSNKFTSSASSQSLAGMAAAGSTGTIRQGQKVRDGFDVDALVNLDFVNSQSALYQVNLNASKFDARMDAINSQGGASNGGNSSQNSSSSNANNSVSQMNKDSTSGKLASSSVNGSAQPSSNPSAAHMSGAAPIDRRNSRKSMVRPPADASLTRLRFAGPISMHEDDRCRSSVGTLQAQKREFVFSVEFGTCLDGTYALPRGLDTEVGVEKIGGKTENESTVWDEEFVRCMAGVEQCVADSKVADKNARLVSALQADDMLAVGCIIAELFNGRPLMNRNDAMLIQRDPSETAQFVFRNTQGLPLAIRRLIVLLLQRDGDVRPKAGEILQACLLPDQELWTNHEVSKQRSGGCEEGYVEFQHASVTAARKEAAESVGDQSPLTMSELLKTVPGYVEVVGASPAEENPALLQSARVEILSDFCDGIFPLYFKTVYRIIGELKLCTDGLRKVCIVLNSLDELLNVPLDGLNLALCHLLDIVGDSTPFQNSSSDDPATSGEEDSSFGYSGSGRSMSVKASPKATVIAEFPRIIDVLGLRLGVEGTEKLLVPKLIDFLNNLMSPELLQCLLYSNLWNIIILRAGVRCFLRYFLHFLLTYISCGTLSNVSRGASDKSNTDIIAPLWATVDIERNEWLHTCPLAILRQVQRAAVTTITNLIEPEALGFGLCARYLMPALLSLIGNPQLATAVFVSNVALVGYTYEDVQRAFANHAAYTAHDSVEQRERDGEASNDLGDRLLASGGSGNEGTILQAELNARDRELLENYIAIKSSYDSQYMYVSQAIVTLSSQLGCLVVSELVLSKIFNGILADIEGQLMNRPKFTTFAALMEVILLLNNVLPVLSAEVVIKDLLQPAKISGLSLPKLLAILPLSPAWSLVDEFSDDSMRYETLEGYVDSQRRHTLLLELCRLIVSSSMIAGADACTDYVLPSVDTFFGNFVASYGMVPIESRTMAKAFELGAELFLPLAQLTGPEAFYTTVPQLNPRLEMWLVSVGSSIPARSPPLPANIWPEVATEEKFQPEKKKGFMNWISGKSKYFSSTTNGAAYPAHVATPTSTAFPPSFNSKSLSSKLSSQGNGSAPFTKPVDERASIVGLDSAPYSLQHLTVPPPPLSQQHVDKEDAMHSPVSSSQLGHHNSNQNSYSMIKRTLASSAKAPIDPNSSVLKSPTDGTELVAMDPHLPQSASVSHRGSIFAGQTQYSNAESSEANNPYHHNLIAALATSSEVSSPVASPSHRSPNPSTHLQTIESATEGDEQMLQETGSSSSTANGDEEDHPPHLNGSGVVEPSEAQDSGDESGSESGDMAYFRYNADGSPRADEVSELSGKEQQIGTTHSTGIEAESGSQRHSMQKTQYDVSEDLKATSSQPFKSYKRLVSGRKIKAGARSSGTNIPGVNINARLLRPSPRKQSKVGSLLSSTLHGLDLASAQDDLESRELYYNEMTWLLAGNGRWNVDKDLRDKSAKEQSRIMRGTKGGGGGAVEWNPAAQVSLTAPRIAVDVAADAGSLFALGMQSNTQWKLEDSQGMIRCMVVNPTESLLMTCSRTGVRLWSLSSHPLLHVSSYSNHSTPPFQAGFMRSGIQATTCDGNVHLWDIESRKTLAFLAHSSDKGPFSSMSVVPPRHGIVPSIGAFGDDQILTTAGNTISYFDVRCNCSKALNGLAEWVIPPLPLPQSNFISSVAESLALSSVASHENYVFAGSTSGGMWTLDRRMGKVLHSWQAHDGPILKITPVSEHHVLSISDRSAAVWEYLSEDKQQAAAAHHRDEFRERDFPSWGVGEVRKALTVRNMPDSVMSPSTLMVGAFDNSLGNGMGMLNSRIGSVQDKGIGLTSKPQFVLYCISGHKMYAGRLPTYDISARDNLHVGQSGGKETGELDELRLSQTYFADRKGTKLSKSKLQVTSSVLLPLRRLLLIGTEDGLVRIVS